MESKLQSEMEKLLKLGKKCELFCKKQALLALKMHCVSKRMDKALFQYVGKESEAKFRWFFLIDKFQCCQKGAKLVQDSDTPIKYTRSTYNPFPNHIQPSKTGETLKKTAVSLHRRTRQQSKLKIDMGKDEQDGNDAVPLSLEESSKNSEDEESFEEVQYINKIRERKNKRQEYKFRLVEAQHSKLDTKKKETTQLQIPTKKQKCNYFQHFIDMDVDIKQFQKQNLLHKTTTFPFHRKYKSTNNSLNASPKKQSYKQNSMIFTTRQWQPLKAQNRQLVLKPFQMNLSPGVTARQSSNKSVGLQQNNLPLTRKKLLIFKNGDKNPAKLKLNQLISLKKLGTMTYCTSLKTMKDVKEVKDTKQNMQSNISIDSKQLVSENSIPDKKLIRIANRKVYEQLIADQSDLANQDLGNYRAKMKLKKEGKVRFDNFS